MKKWENHIEANPEIMYGKLVIKGTRIPVDLILEKMANGRNFTEINKDYPDIKEDDLYACLNYISPS